MLRKYEYTLASGAEMNPIINGRFISLTEISDLGEIEINAIDEEGKSVAVAPLKLGEKVRASTPFKNINITNNTGNEVTFTIVVGEGDFSSDRVNGVVEVSNVVDTLSEKAPAPELEFISNASTAGEMISPTENINGVLIYSISQFNCMLSIGDDSASAVPFLISEFSQTLNYVGGFVGAVYLPLKIPAGKGLYYFRRTAAGANTLQLGVKYL